MEVSHTAECIGKLTECVDNLLHQARTDLQGISAEEFVEKKISRLFGVVKAYNTCFDSLNVKTRKELERSLQRQFRHQVIQERVEHLEEVERDWDTFLKDIESNLYQEEKAAVREAGGHVLVMSFGSQVGAQRWLEDTGCPFDMLLDETRELYEAFGLKRSVHKVWCITAMVYYAEQLSAGVPPITPYENVEDDPHQMGGDFILDKAGTVRLVYCSQTSADRPSFEYLIDVLQDCSKTSDTSDEATTNI